MTLLAGPFFPGLIQGWYRWRYRRKLDELVRDLDAVSGTLETYRPLSELTESMRADVALEPRERSH